MTAPHAHPNGAQTVPDLPSAGGRGMAIALTEAGLLFVLYPAIRPFTDEASLHGAQAFTSTPWLVAHTLAMAAFLLLTLGLLGLHLRLQRTPLAHRSMRALITTWIGVGMTLPFYGAETFGLAAIGHAAYERGDPTLLAVAEAVRLGPGIALLMLGLLLVAVGSAMFAAAIWKTERRARWRGIPLTIGLVLYLPQFLATQPVRIAHGALMAFGCLLVARTAAPTNPHPNGARYHS
jgi:hypothetical protein